MSDWAGSSRLRSRRRDDCVYPGTRPTPRPVTYRVRKGTNALIKRAGDRNWRQFTTLKSSDFDSTYRETSKSYVFFRVGYLLCVDKNFVEIRTSRTGDAPEALEECIDHEYLQIVT